MEFLATILICIFGVLPAILFKCIAKQTFSKITAILLMMVFSFIGIIFGSLITGALLDILIDSPSLLSLIAICTFTYSLFYKPKQIYTIDLLKSIKTLPKTNYHILGYISYCYLIFIFLISLDDKIEIGYYEVLRWLVTSFTAWTAFRIYKVNNQSKWLLLFSAISILFNPIIKITFEKEVWLFIDIATIIILTIYAIKNYKSTKKDEKIEEIAKVEIENTDKNEDVENIEVDNNIPYIQVIQQPIQQPATDLKTKKLNSLIEDFKPNKF